MINMQKYPNDFFRAKPDSIPMANLINPWCISEPYVKFKWNAFEDLAFSYQNIANLLELNNRINKEVGVFEFDQHGLLASFNKIIDYKTIDFINGWGIITNFFDTNIIYSFNDYVLTSMPDKTFEIVFGYTIENISEECIKILDSSHESNSEITTKLISIIEKLNNSIK